MKKRIDHPVVLNKVHKLDALLTPKSIAFVGASPTEGTIGNDMIRTLVAGGYEGDIYFINPKYSEIDNRPCYASLSALPQTPDLVVLSVAGHRIEGLFDEAIKIGVGGVVIFDACHMVEEADTTLLERLKSKAQAAGMPVCGGNGMGYFNFIHNTHAGFHAPSERKAGNITLIAHSGSVFILPVSNDPRFRFNLAVSAGQEIGTTVADYLDYTLEQPSTGVVALFLETVRDPAGFEAALKKANERGVPVLVTKVGRTEASARLAATHSGAIAGNDAAYEALFDRYGVIRTASLDEMLATAQLLSQPQRVGPGGIGYVSDSGGLRELAIDIASDIDVPFAQITDETTDRLRSFLPMELAPVNPLDCAGPMDANYLNVFEQGVRTVMEDPNVAIGILEVGMQDSFIYEPGLIALAKEVQRYSDKPFVVINTLSSAQNCRIAEDLADSGVPLINGVEHALKAISHAMKYREFMARQQMVTASVPDEDIVLRWRQRLTQGEALGEADSLALLSDFGVPTVKAQVANDRNEAMAVAQAVGFPLVLKTAMPGIHHKSDVGGVVLGLADIDAFTEAYDDLVERLGPRVTVEPMADEGVELAFGLVKDPQFGPLVMVSSGGVLIEVLSDRAFALPPFDLAQAHRLLDKLKVKVLLDGVRGRPAANIEHLAESLVRFSEMAAVLGDVLLEVDVNPVLVGPSGCIAVDALVIADSISEAFLV
ncbi:MULTISPECIES: acetate--CoA ligase family protein [Marinobacter]|uniref:acetate--CoA ligase family protein n=1 Tax=Marinobacter TaxID=2742 RepID=UPI001904E9CA|nr:MULTISPECIES: acetate--CoA ligase family protein [unclassified Marinobacter]MBK1887889.1 acetate--CoA ligase family protein [Marinobacter sp. DY40_1A1]